MPQLSPTSMLTSGKGGLITRPAGYVGADAYEVDLRTDLAVGDTVRFFQTRDKTGAMKEAPQPPHAYAISSEARPKRISIFYRTGSTGCTT